MDVSRPYERHVAGALVNCAPWLLRRYHVEKGYDPVTKEDKPGVPEWPLVIQDMVVDTPIAGDPPGVCRLKYDRMPGGA
jgi:hypothetical protein